MRYTYRALTRDRQLIVECVGEQETIQNAIANGYDIFVLERWDYYQRSWDHVRLFWAENLLADMAKQALAIQDASNLSGLVKDWANVIETLREIFPNVSTDEINRHPINILWADKCLSLAMFGWTETFGAAYEACRKLAGILPAS